MLATNILLQIFFSLFIIFIIHYTYNYLKDTYSCKKTKDLVGFQVQKYQDIIQEMQNNQSSFISEQSKELMKNELAELVLAT
jgi:hypothetical protein